MSTTTSTMTATATTSHWYLLVTAARFERKVAAQITLWWNLPTWCPVILETWQWVDRRQTIEILKWPKNTGQSKINTKLLSHERNTKEIQFSL